MKTKIYRNTSLIFAVMFFAALLTSQQSKAQMFGTDTTVYSQTFNAAYPNWPTGWVSSSVNGWVMDTSSANQSYTWNSTSASGYSWASGGAMVEVSNPDNGDTATYSLISPSVSTLGIDSVVITFGARLTSHFADSGSTVKYLEWSSNGGTTWNSLSFTQNQNNSNWYVINDSMPIALPSTASNQASIEFRWVAFIHSNTRSGSASGTFRFDDFYVLGDKISTGISKVSTASPASLFPNPASNFVTVNNLGGNNYMVRICDITGQNLKTTYISNSENKIDVSDLTPGFYMMQLVNSDNNVQQTLKLVVVH